MKKRIFLAIAGYSLLLIGAVACMRPEKPWPRPQGGETTALSADLGPEYDTVAFISFSRGLVHKVPRQTWDIEVHSLEGGYRVWTNAAMYAFAAVIDSLSWASVSDPSTLSGWKCDLPDTVALPILRYGERLTFVLDRDKGAIFYTRMPDRYKKLWLMATQEGLEIKVYALTGELVGEWRVARSPNPQYLSLDRPGQFVSVLPPWEVELILTRYVHYFPEQPEAFRYYPVLGALAAEGSRSAQVSTAEKPFEDFTYADLQGVVWKTQRDAIGYDWKRYDFNTGTYVIDFSRYYVLEVGPEQYYKLQFVDFYDASGRKGSVKVRYSAL